MFNESIQRFALFVSTENGQAVVTVILVVISFVGLLILKAASDPQGALSDLIGTLMGYNTRGMSDLFGRQ